MSDRESTLLALQAENARLRQNEENFRSFFDTIDHLLFVLDRQGTVQHANHRACSTLGYTEAELLGQSVLQLHPPDRREEVRIIFEGMVGGRAHNCPVPLLTKDGRQLPVETRVVSGQWSGQSVLFGVCRDLSALQASEEKFSKAFQSSPALMAISNIDDGCIIDVNAAFTRSVGYTRDELIGHSSLELGLFVNPVQRAIMVEAIRTTGRLHDLEVEVRTKHGEGLLGLFSAELIQLQDQPRLLTVLNDITARKRAETALQQMNAMLEQRVIERTRELTEANMHLTELDRLKDEFISRISHELRTPLTSIKAYVELLESGVIDEPARYFEILRVQTDKLYHVIEDLLDVSRLSRDDVDIHPLPISLDAFINGLAAGRQAEADRRGLKLVTRLNGNLPLINTDPALLRQVMLNLLNNALSYTPTGGTITLSAQQRLLGLKPWVIIEVSDTGHGISERDLPHIFEPFYRGEAASDYRTPGAGVGLSIAQYIIEKLGGQIIVETAVEAGAVFSVYVNRAGTGLH